MSLVVVILLIVFVLGPLARAAAGRLSAGDHATLPGSAHEVVRLREEVDRLSAEVARLAEEQAFTLKLLAPGGETGEGPHPAEEPLTPRPPLPQGEGASTVEPVAEAPKST